MPLEHDESYNVCIKVTSCSVHRLLVSPSSTRITFRGLKCSELSEVLLCVWSESKSGVVTIMRDLKKDQYQNLKPCSCSNLDALWHAFKSLVTCVLLPLAQQHVVHCDIRPGWDYTANIMVKLIDDAVELRLIDYDSLVLISTCYEIPMDHRSFHIRHDVKRSKVTALAFLWWQCILISNTWLNRTVSKSMNVEKFVADCQWGDIKIYFPEGLNGDDYLFLNEISSGKEVKVKDIKRTLDCLAKAFHSTSSRKCVFSSQN